ncbi:hypothetical protein JO379_000664 [Streptomyces syringium]|uniref:Uncharacterized protein n=1 Tax=Streptomyces syringium TaxID=76729 RepID=A0ABS4XXY0_9ACTN|nr:hypothetical protein [Streptomyces syringium]
MSHIHRALIHHLSEVRLLRDFSPHLNPAMNGAIR